MLIIVLTTILSTAVLIASVLFAVSLLRLKRFSDVIVAWGLGAFTHLVLVFQIANLLLRINDRAVILGLQGLVLLITLGLWLRLGRPAILPALPRTAPLRQMLTDAKNWPLLVLGAALLGVLALDLVLIYVVPPNNNDALQIHLSRVLMWKQFGSYFPWETNRIWQLTFPVNAQLTYLWTILFTQSDHFVALIPYLAGVSSAILVYRFSRELGFSVRPAIFSGMVWLSFPVVQLHLTSVRHDLISTWLFLSTVVYFYVWMQSHQRAHLILSALALGLVVGTNFSIAAYLPGLVIMVAIFWIARKVTFRQIATWGAAALLAFLFLSSPIFISNTLHFGSPLGPDAGEMTAGAVAGEVSMPRYLAINSARWAYQFIDTSGLPQPLWGYGIKLKALFASAICQLLNFQVEGDLATMAQHEFTFRTVFQLQEDEAWYGLLGWLLAFPTSLWAIWRGFKSRKWLFLAIPVFLMSAFITGTLIRPGWTPYDGRYFMPAVAFSAATLPLWFSIDRPKLTAVLRWVFVLLSISSIVMVIDYNPAKEVFGDHPIWMMNRIDKLTRQSYTTKDMLYLVEDAIPPYGTVGIATDNLDYQEYGVFGEKFTRRVYPITPPDRLGDEEWLAARGIDYLLIFVSPNYPAEIAPSYRYVDSAGNWVVYAKQQP